MNFFGPWGLGAAALAGTGFGGGFAAAGSMSSAEKVNQDQEYKKQLENKNNEIQSLNGRIEAQKKRIDGLMHDGNQMLKLVQTANAVTRDPANCGWWDGTRNKYWDHVHTFKFDNQWAQLKYRVFGCLKLK